MDSLNPTRLDLARRRRGLTKTKLAEIAGVSTRILSDYEKGRKQPTEKTLQALAGALNFPVTFFAGDDIEEPSLDGVSFRSMSSMTARQRDQACGAAALALRLDDWIHDRFELPQPNLPRIENLPPEQAAEALRALWDLGEKRAPNMVHLLEAHGVRVFSLVQDCAEVDAFSFWRRGVPYVFLNSRKSAERSRMDAAHELGHLALHVHGGPGGRQAEDEAQSFGSAFLMPRRSVLADAPRGATVPQILKLKRRWNVAAMNLAYRMHKLQLLTDWQARSTYIQLARMGYRDDEPEGIARERSQVLDKVFTSLRADGVSRRDVARILNIPTEELNRVVFGLTLASETTRPRQDRAPNPSGPPDLQVVSSRQD